MVIAKHLLITIKQCSGCLVVESTTQPYTQIITHEASNLEPIYCVGEALCKNYGQFLFYSYVIGKMESLVKLVL